MWLNEIILEVLFEYTYIYVCVCVYIHIYIYIYTYALKKTNQLQKILIKLSLFLTSLMYT